MKYRSRQIISSIKYEISGKTFKFPGVNEKNIIKKLSTKKADQSTDISLKIIKEKADIFESYLCELCNDCINKGIFPNVLKDANITTVFKKSTEGLKKTTAK